MPLVSPKRFLTLVFFNRISVVAQTFFKEKCVTLACIILSWFITVVACEMSWA